MNHLRHVTAAAALAVAITAPLRAALVVHYDFDEGTGTTAVDQAGTAQNATLSTGASYSSDMTVGQWALNTGTGYADLGMFRLPDTFTIAGWVKFDNIASPAQMRILFANSNTGSGSSGIRIFINSYNTSDRRIRVETANGTVTDAAETSAGAFPADGAYHHVACVIRKTSGTADIYVDGIKQTLTDSTIRTDFSTYQWTRIGATVNGSFPAQAKIDDMRIYDQALSDSEIGLLAWRYDVWQSMHIGSGGFLQQLLYCPSDPQRLYMLGDVGGMFRSDDYGTTWRMIHGGFPYVATTYCPRSMLVDPSDANKLVVAVGQKATSPVSGRIFVSADGGTTWSQTASVVRIEGDGQFRQAGDMLVRDPANAQHILACPIGNTVMSSTDGGSTWASNALSENVVPAAVVFDRRGGTVWLSSPYGWSPAAGSPSMTYTPGLFRSTDSGATWTRLFTPTASSQVPTELLQDPVDASKLWGLFPGSVQVKYSLDGGTTWTACTTGLAAYPSSWGSRADGIYGSIAASGNSVLVGGYGCNNYLFNGSTQSWSRVGPTTPVVRDQGWWGYYGRPGVPAHFGCNLSFLTADPRNTSNWAFTDWYAMYQSKDAGASWRLSIDGVEMTVVHMVAQQPDNDSAVHAGMGDVGYFRTLNGSQRLESVTNPITNNVKCISASRVQTGRLYATSNRTDSANAEASQVFVSSDSGATWTTTNMPGSTSSWKNSHFCNTVVADPAVLNRVWIGESGAITNTTDTAGIYRSDDGGSTWAAVPMPAASSFFRSKIFDGHQELAVDTNGSIVACSGGNKRIIAKPYNSSNWYEVTIPSASDKPNAVVADPSSPGRFYVAMQYSGLWRTTDAGLNWTRIIDEGVFHVGVDQSNNRADTPRRVTVVTYTTVALSADGGDTWRKYPETMPYRSYRNTVAFSGDRVIVGTTGNGVFRASTGDLTGTPAPLTAPPVGAMTSTIIP